MNLELKFSKNTYLILAVTTLLVYFFIGLAQLDHFSLCPDQILQEKRGFFSAKAYLSLISHNGMTSYYLDNLGELKHPSFFSTIATCFSGILRNTFNFQQVESLQLPIFLISCFGLVGLFLAAKMLLKEEVAFFSILALAIFPRFIGHAHSNPKDIPLMAFSIWTVYFFAKYQLEKRKSNLILAALFLAFSATTELNGLTLMVSLALSAIWINHTSFKRSNLIAIFKSTIIFLGFFMFFSFLCWPILWKNPFTTIQSLLYFSGNFYPIKVFFEGEFYAANRLPWYYTIWNLLVATPTLLICLFILGAKKMRQEKDNGPLSLTKKIVLPWVLIPLGLRLFPNVTRYDDIRHIFYIIPGLMLFVGVGMAALNQTWKQLRFNFPLKTYVPTAALLLYGFSQIFPTHPYEESYFNEIFRLKYSHRIEESFKFPTWSPPLRAVAKWANENAEPNAQICVPKLARILAYYDFRPDLSLNCQDYDYRVVILQGTDYQKRFKDGSVFNINLYNSSLGQIYSSEK